MSKVTAVVPPRPGHLGYHVHGVFFPNGKSTLELDLDNGRAKMKLERAQKLGKIVVVAIDGKQVAAEPAPAAEVVPPPPPPAPGDPGSPAKPLTPPPPQDKQQTEPPARKTEDVRSDRTKSR